MAQNLRHLMAIFHNILLHYMSSRLSVLGRYRRRIDNAVTIIADNLSILGGEKTPAVTEILFMASFSPSFSPPAYHDDVTLPKQVPDGPTREN